jgi:hypothetical protein
VTVSALAEMEAELLRERAHCEDPRTNFEDLLVMAETRRDHLHRMRDAEGDELADLRGEVVDLTHIMSELAAELNSQLRNLCAGPHAVHVYLVEWPEA